MEVLKIRKLIKVYISRKFFQIYQDMERDKYSSTIPIIIQSPVSKSLRNTKYFMVDTQNVVLLDGNNGPRRWDSNEKEFNKQLGVM